MTLQKSEFAVYLPAVNDTFAKTVATSMNVSRPFPKSLSIEDLAFWEPNGLWHYPYLLNSVGLYAVGSLPDNAVTRRTPGASVLVGDSGGFQIGKGTMKGLSALKDKPMKPEEAIAAWANEYRAREWILGWLDTYAEYSMTIDLPLWARTKDGEKSPFHNCSVDQLIGLTVDTLKYIEAFKHGRTKWLNVVQGGANLEETKQWWDAVKWFRHGGWALAGSAGASGGLYQLLHATLTMREEKAFVPGQDWLHVLGVSTPLWAVLLSAIQKALRVHNPNLQVSFDSSSPFQHGGRYEKVASLELFSSEERAWKFKLADAPQSALDVNSQASVTGPLRLSPIGKVLTLGHLSVKGGMFDKRNYDSVSNALICHHNTWAYVDAFERANKAVAAGDTSCVPQRFLDAVQMIELVFSQSDWRKALDECKGICDDLLPSPKASKEESIT